MLLLNGKEVEAKKYPDGALLLRQSLDEQELWQDGDSIVGTTQTDPTITWHYEDDREIFVLFCLTRHLQNLGFQVKLFMPYIPHARMDRVKRPRDVFTLKYFAEIINSLGFKSVIVLDPHSPVSEGLLDRRIIITPENYVTRAIEMIGKEGVNTDELLMFYPDDGAKKRYEEFFKRRYAFGIKDRDWDEGKIVSLEVLGAKDRINGSNILMVDDICSRGWTFHFAAKALKQMGANKIYLFVTHCENTILEGEVLTGGLVEKVYTTNSICTLKHEKVEVFKV